MYNVLDVEIQESEKFIADGLLEKYILVSGLKISFLCEMLGISKQGLYKKRIGVTPFKAAEIFVLCDLLKINIEDRQKIFT